EVEEAIRVVHARNKQTIAGDLRAELPAVYREMAFIRQSDAPVPSKSNFREYPLVRFIVEIKTLIQSDFNATRTRRFKLETAVIENTKNSRKSVFIPHDLQKGFGEGTYFQAILLLAGT